MSANLRCIEGLRARKDVRPNAVADEENPHFIFPQFSLSMRVVVWIFLFAEEEYELGEIEQLTPHLNISSVFRPGLFAPKPLLHTSLCHLVLPR